MDETVKKSPVAEREERTLAFWREKKIFEKTLKKKSPKGEFIFYDGPPFATGAPHYGHILAGTIKDVVPRYKTMQGYHVPRRWGWDCHGLPVENLIEKELGLKSKREIEDLGIEIFNEKARASVLRYDKEWKDVVPRTGRFVDMDNAYLTMNPSYMESVWWSFKTLYEKKLVYEGFKSMHICPRCETTLSNFEVNLGYKDITDISVYVKFELVNEPNTFLIAWTTTPWTLPGNVALAVSSDIVYVKAQKESVKYILAKNLVEKVLKEGYEIVEEIKGKDLVGKKYKPVFDYYTNDTKLENKENAWQVYDADFVTTDTGTGIVHIAPAFGADDYTLSQKEKLPFIQHVGMDGKFKKEVTDFAGQSVKPKEDHQKTDVEIIKYLAHKGLLFAKEKIIHSYPHCWRCETPLLNYATSSWFVRVSDIKDKLRAENRKVKWVPQEIGSGRFDKGLESAPDWAVSRSRYWGSTIPVWRCIECKKIEVVGSVEELRQKTKRSGFFVMRHGEAEHNKLNILSGKETDPYGLTVRGKESVEKTAKSIKQKIDIIVASPLLRTKETAEIVASFLGISSEKIVYDNRLKEVNFGDLNGKPVAEYHKLFTSHEQKFIKSTPNGETLADQKHRLGEFWYEYIEKYKDKNVLVITHEYPAWLLKAVSIGADVDGAVRLKNNGKDDFLATGELLSYDIYNIPHNKNYELDLHRPYIDEVVLSCSCGANMKRVPEVFDAWYESGSMPYASRHYPFENSKKTFFGGKKITNYPAEFIAEGLDQTRGWFYSLMVLNTALFGHAPYKNVVVNGLVLAEDGRKMSKSLKNYPDVGDVLNKYGADAMRYYMISSPIVRSEDLAFSERGVDEVAKKIIGRLSNVCTFFDLYAKAGEYSASMDRPKSSNVLDNWIFARLDETTEKMSESLDVYELDKASRPIADFVDDLSTWYVRRSRDRFKGENEEDKKIALSTTAYVLIAFSKLLAPFMPFVAEDVYSRFVKKGSGVESVHLESWPETHSFDENILSTMETARRIVTRGLEVRAKSGIKVRQPLRALSIGVVVPQEFADIIKDELNVKELILDKSMGDAIELDTVLSDDLVQEGRMREFVRAVQEMRKEKQLKPQDSIVLVLKTDDKGKKLIERYQKEIQKIVNARSVVYRDTQGTSCTIEDISFVISFE